MWYNWCVDNIKKYIKCILNWEKRPTLTTDRFWRIRKNRGFILFGVRWLFFLLDILMPLIILRIAFCCRACSGHLSEDRKWLIEIYNLVFFAIAIAVLYFVNPSWLCCWINFFIIIFIWRLIDIFQSGFYLSFLRKIPPGLLPGRSLILILINYAEIIFIFAVIYFVNIEHFIHLEDTFDSLKYSASVFIPFINTYNYVNPQTYVGNLIFYAEIVLSLFIHLFIVGRVLSYFKR